MESLEEYLKRDDVNVVVRMRFFYAKGFRPYDFIEFGNLILSNISSSDREKYVVEINELKKLIGLREARLEATK